MRKQLTKACVRALALLGLLTSLGGCSYPFDMVVRISDNVILFDVAPKDKKRARCAWNFMFFERRQDGGSDVAWSWRSADYTSCASSYPIRYGTTPKGVVQERSPKPLKVGVIYEYTSGAYGGGIGGGCFRLISPTQVENIAC